MKKAAEAFRSIGEVSQLVGVAPHVLRYWETQFPLFSPVKRRDGRRYYRPDDVRMAAGLCELLREEGVSIRGAKKQMKTDRGASVKARGGARLGAEFADAATSQSGAKRPEPASATDTARKRKSSDSTSLPLFPDLETRNTEDAESHPAAVDTAPAAPKRPAAAQASVDWLGRLVRICNELQHQPDIGADDLVTIRDQLANARRRLAA
ncbi:MerR family transcriptional regulator [Paracoccus albus]|uniref:MerR family transcriptional regulator n=1 Tax=Paracoccus albus TaxID=3017784 RepID=UPI0022F0D099|nr:MerR family transcriptional regulator [Paracoccus albus]WBU61777.1 MerR family transcriptional regulator [Paracoccus albus]